MKLLNFIFIFWLGQISLFAQDRIRFDCGSPNSAIFDDFTRLSLEDKYTKKKGFGWIKPPTGAFERPRIARFHNAMMRDGVVGKSLNLRVDMPKGIWVLTFWTETGKEDSSTQKVIINGKNIPTQYQNYFKPAEPRDKLKITNRIFHQKIEIGNKGLRLEIEGGQDSVRLLGLILEKGTTSAYTDNFLSNYEYWFSKRGWEKATEETGLSMFDRYEMALANLDAYLNLYKSTVLFESDKEYRDYETYRKALYDKARILYWLDKEVHNENYRLQAQTIFKQLREDYVESFNKRATFFSEDDYSNALNMYLGKKIITTSPCNTLKPHENAPAWSKAQLEAHCRLKLLADWWILERQAENGEFGGKIDDDVELLRCLTPLVLRGDKTAIQGWTKLANGVWQSPQMSRGFLKRIRDVEHAAEYFSDTGPMMAILSDDTVFTKRFEPYKHYFENVWMGISTQNHRFFKSAWLSATAVDTTNPRNRDLPFSALAVKPLRYLAWKTGDTTAIRLLHEWSKAWRDVALRTDKGKPKGIIPPSVRYPDEAINGDEKTWYQTNMFWQYFEWDYGTYWKMYDQLLFTTQMTGDSTLLEPLFETLNLIKKHALQLSKSSQLLESFAKGSEQWAVQNLIQETGFWTVVSAWRFWSNDSRFDDLLKKYGSPYARFRLTGDDSDLAKGYEKMLQYLRYNFPMVTSEALFTDRVYLTEDGSYDPADYARALLTGDEIQISSSPYPAVTWTDCPDDLTVLVSESTPKSLKINFFLHNKQAKKASLRLWQLEKGVYQITTGSHSEKIEVKKRGQDFIINIEPNILQKLIIQKQ